MVLFFILLLFIISGTIKYLYIPESTLVFNERTKEVLNLGRGFYVQINSYEEERFEELKMEGFIDKINTGEIEYKLSNKDKLNLKVGELVKENKHIKYSVHVKEIDAFLVCSVSDSIIIQDRKCT